VAISSAQQTKLKATRQKFTAFFATFAVPSITFSNDTGGALDDNPMVVITPRYSRCAPSGTINFSASLSFKFNGGGSVDTYTWTVVSGGGSFSAGNVASPTYTAPATPALVKVSCAVTDGAKTTTGFAYIRVSNSSEDVAEILAMKGSAPGATNWQMKVRLPKPASVTNWTQDKVICLHVDDVWDGSGDTFSSYGRAQNVVVGVIRGGTVFEDFNHRYVVAEVVSPTVLLQGDVAQIEETLWSAAAGSGIHSIANFNPSDAAFHLLRHHSNYWEYFNVYRLFDDDGNRVANLKVHAGPLLALIEDIAARTLLVVFCDRHGNMLYVPDPDARRVDDYWVAKGSVMTFTNDQWMTILVEHIKPDQVVQVNCVGILSNLTEVGGGYPVVSGAGDWPTPGKEVKGLICANAATLDSWAEGLYAKYNADYAVTLTLPLNHCFDINDEVGITYASDQTGVGINWTAKSFRITSINHRVDLDGKTWKSQLNLIEWLPWSS